MTNDPPPFAARTASASQPPSPPGPYRPVDAAEPLGTVVREPARTMASPFLPPDEPPHYSDPSTPDVIKVLGRYLCTETTYAPFTNRISGEFYTLLTPGEKKPLIRFPRERLAALPENQRMDALLFIFGLQAKPQLSGHCFEIDRPFENIRKGYSLTVGDQKYFYPLNEKEKIPGSMADLDHVTSNPDYQAPVLQWGRKKGMTLEGLAHVFGRIPSLYSQHQPK